MLDSRLLAAAWESARTGREMPVLVSHFHAAGKFAAWSSAGRERNGSLFITVYNSADKPAFVEYHKAGAVQVSLQPAPDAVRRQY